MYADLRGGPRRRPRRAGAGSSAARGTAAGSRPRPRASSCQRVEEHHHGRDQHLADADDRRSGRRRPGTGVTWSTSLVTRETSAPRRSVFWVSSGRSCTCRNALIRSVARPRSDAGEQPRRSSGTTRRRSPRSRPRRRSRHPGRRSATSGPPGAVSPRSRVCCTAIGTTTRPTVASTASSSVPPMPSVSSGRERDAAPDRRASRRSPRRCPPGCRSCGHGRRSSARGSPSARRAPARRR